MPVLHVGYLLFHRFPQFFRIPPLPQTHSLRQLAPHCVNPATSIRIANKLFLKSINLRATIVFDSSSPSSYRECGGLPRLFFLSHPASHTLSFFLSYPRHADRSSIARLERSRRRPHSFHRLSNLQTFQRSNVLSSKSFRMRSSAKCTCNPFRMRTSKSLDLKSRVMNTYKTGGGEGSYC